MTTQATRGKVNGFTIDAEHSRDLDDAIWMERVDNLSRISVSIADVAAIVWAGSKSDQMARERAFTRYYATGNKPMLPRRVSEMKGSLLAGKRRRTVTVSFSVDEDMEIVDVAVRRTELTSACKFSYEKVDRIINGQEDSEFAAQLQDMNRLAQAMLEGRRRHGALAIYDLNKGWRTNEEGMLVPLTERDSHMANIIVQEFMIAANQAVAQFLIANGAIPLFRNHTAKPIVEGRTQLLSELADAIEHPDLLDIETLRRKVHLSLNRANYGTALEGHYGLNLPAYLHFTSPIRRYPDLINHRILMSVLDAEAAPYSVEELTAICAHVNKIQDELKETRDAYHKEQRKRELRSTVAGGDYHALDVDTFHRLIKLSSRESELTPEFEAEVLRRLNASLLQPRSLYFLLIESKGVSTDLKKAIFAAILRNAHWAISIFELCRQNQHWPEPKFKMAQTNGGTFAASASIMIGERVYETTPQQSHQRKSAYQKAAVALLARVLDADAPQVVTQAAPDLTPGNNPKGRLLEVCQKLGLEAKYEHQCSGPDHIKMFSASVSVRRGDEVLLSSGTFEGATKREAEREASRDLLTKMATAEG